MARILRSLIGEDEGVLVADIAGTILGCLVGPGIIVEFLVAEIEDAALIREIGLVQIGEVVLGDLDGDGIVEASIIVHIIGNGCVGYEAVEVLAVIAVSHLNETS